MKKNTKFILALFLIIFITAFVSEMLGLNAIALSHFKEPFVQNFESCVDQFYPKWWCLRTPIQSGIDNGYCHCGNGQLGTYQMGGKCFCYPDNPTFPYYTENKFFDYPGN